MLPKQRVFELKHCKYRRFLIARIFRKMPILTEKGLATPASDSRLGGVE